ncbi:putative ankyrin repeat protein [Trichoplax sp. H2]|nr:putative ankyrin repeat protein [Trichoplax sp. H2]|eukprot:RDD39203.1 putative ankyrin repeat protein [Trichoplax sp. H2]
MASNTTTTTTDPGQNNSSQNAAQNSTSPQNDTQSNDLNLFRKQLWHAAETGSGEEFVETIRLIAKTIFGSDCYSIQPLIVGKNTHDDNQSDQNKNDKTPSLQRQFSNILIRSNDGNKNDNKNNNNNNNNDNNNYNESNAVNHASSQIEKDRLHQSALTINKVGYVDERLKNSSQDNQQQQSSDPNQGQTAQLQQETNDTKNEKKGDNQHVRDKLQVIPDTADTKPTAKDSQSNHEADRNDPTQSNNQLASNNINIDKNNNNDDDINATQKDSSLQKETQGLTQQADQVLPASNQEEVITLSQQHRQLTRDATRTITANSNQISSDVDDDDDDNDASAKSTRNDESADDHNSQLASNDINIDKNNNNDDDINATQKDSSLQEETQGLTQQADQVLPTSNQEEIITPSQHRQLTRDATRTITANSNQISSDVDDDDDNDASAKSTRNDESADDHQSSSQENQTTLENNSNSELSGTTNEESADHEHANIMQLTKTEQNTKAIEKESVDVTSDEDKTIKKNTATENEDDNQDLDSNALTSVSSKDQFNQTTASNNLIEDDQIKNLDLDAKEAKASITERTSSDSKNDGINTQGKKEKSSAVIIAGEKDQPEFSDSKDSEIQANRTEKLFPATKSNEDSGEETKEKAEERSSTSAIIENKCDQELNSSNANAATINDQKALDAVSDTTQKGGQLQNSNTGSTEIQANITEDKSSAASNDNIVTKDKAENTEERSAIKSNDQLEDANSNKNGRQSNDMEKVSSAGNNDNTPTEDKNKKTDQSAATREADKNNKNVTETDSNAAAQTSANERRLEYTHAMNMNLIAAVRVLVGQGGDVNAKDSNGLPLLHWAIRLGSMDIVQMLLHAGADVNIRNAKGSSPIIFSLLFNREAIIYTLLNIDNKAGNTSSRKAVNAGLLAGVIALAGLPGINCELADKYKSAMTVSFSPQFMDLVPADSWSTSIDYLAMTKAGLNALHVALYYGNDDPIVLESLLKNGCIANAKTNVSRVTEVDFGDLDGYKPCHFGAIAGKAKMLKILVQADTDVDVPTKKGYTSLYLAAARNFYDVVKVLIEAGADVNKVTATEGLTPLHVAAYKNFLAIAKLLVDAGAYVDIPSKTKSTPLRNARNYPEMLKLLEDPKSKRFPAPNTANTNKNVPSSNANASVKTPVNNSKGTANSNTSGAANSAAANKKTATPASKTVYLFQTTTKPAVNANTKVAVAKPAANAKVAASAPIPKPISELEERAAGSRAMAQCSYKLFCEEFVNSLGILPSFINPGFNRCFCQNCYKGQSVLQRGKPPRRYAIPHGWVRVAIAIDQRLEQQVFNDFHVAYHGTQAKAVKSIIESCQLLLPGDTTSTGFKIPILTNHAKDGTFSLVANGKDSTGVNKYKVVTRHKEGCKCGCAVFTPKRLFFTSPTIKYCEHATYAGYGSNYKNGKMKCILQVRQRPGSYHILNETVGATRRGETIDKQFKNDEVACFTSCRYPAIVPCGIMVKYIKSVPKAKAK